MSEYNQIDKAMKPAQREQRSGLDKLSLAEAIGHLNECSGRTWTAYGSGPDSKRMRCVVICQKGAGKYATSQSFTFKTQTDAVKALSMAIIEAEGE